LVCAAFHAAAASAGLRSTLLDLLSLTGGEIPAGCAGIEALAPELAGWEGGTLLFAAPPDDAGRRSSMILEAETRSMPCTPDLLGVKKQ
jgi:hypothetical protein